MREKWRNPSSLAITANVGMLPSLAGRALTRAFVSGLRLSRAGRTSPSVSPPVGRANFGTRIRMCKPWLWARATGAGRHQSAVPPGPVIAAPGPVIRGDSVHDLPPPPGSLSIVFNPKQIENPDTSARQSPHPHWGGGEPGQSGPKSTSQPRVEGFSGRPISTRIE